MRPIKFVTRSALVCSLLLLTPMTFSPAGGLEDNLACSEEQSGASCAREIDAICTAGEKPVINWYTKAG